MIHIANLSKTIGSVQVLSGITLTLEAGKIHGFAGPNGSGKTMLMRMIAGLARPSHGYVVIDGQRVGRGIAFPASLGLLLEGPTFLDSYTGFKNLWLLASIRRAADRETVRSWISRVGLDPNDRRRYRNYSLGMKQRLGIAGAFMETPGILLLDEPTNALDSNGVVLFTELVTEAKERGATVVLSCHDVTVLQTLADEIWSLEQGYIIAHKTRPANRWEARP